MKKQNRKNSNGKQSGVSGSLPMLKKLIKQYFKCIEYVPMRAVDCDQERENMLRDKIKKLLKSI